jgi:outer membrane lipoprotein
MRFRRPPGFLLCGLTFFLMFGCAYPISRGVRHQAARNLTFSQVLADPAAHRGALVIWGGIIMKTINHPHSTELIVLETSLGFWETPKGPESSGGKFIAVTPRFLEPEIYRRGTRITVAGVVEGRQLMTLKGIAYAYPLIKIKEIHHWWKIKPWYPETSYYGADWAWDTPFYTPEGYIQEMKAP